MSGSDRAGAMTDVGDGSILVVCTQNVCCSPYVERLLISRLAGTAISVSSAGTAALTGSIIDPAVAARLIEAGADPAGFSPRQLTLDLVAGADLVLCSSREQRAAVVREAPAGLRRTYALADFSDLAALVSIENAVDPNRSGETSYVGQVREIVERARGQVQARKSTDAAIVDPYGQPQRVFDQMFAQVDHLLPPIIAALTGVPFSDRRHPRRGA